MPSFTIIPTIALSAGWGGGDIGAHVLSNVGARYRRPRVRFLLPRLFMELHPYIPTKFQPPTAPGRSNHPGVYRPVDARTNRE